MVRILLVDDDIKWLNLFSSMVTLMGFDVATANGGDEALRRFLKMHFDIVFTDLNMPGMDGWSVSRRIKHISPKTPIVLVTASEREPILEKIGDSAADFALFKPFGLKELENAVQNVSEHFKPWNVAATQES